MRNADFETLFDPDAKSVYMFTPTDPNYEYRKIPKNRFHKNCNRFVTDIIQLSGVIGGGYVRWLASPLEAPVLPEDVDIFSTYDHSFNYLKSYLEKSCGLKPVEENGVFISYFKPSGDMSRFIVNVPPFKIQLIKPLFGDDVYKILNSFDFSVCRAALSDTMWAIVDKDFLKHEAEKRIVIKNEGCNPHRLLSRIAKYAKKGYTIPSLEIISRTIKIDKIPQSLFDVVASYLNNQSYGADLFVDEIAQLYKEWSKEHNNVTWDYMDSHPEGKRNDVYRGH